MARKDRVPNPPKRSQGPQRRSTTTDPGASEQRRRVLYLVAGSGLAALAAVLAVIFLTGGGSDDERATLVAAGCTLVDKPASVGEHSVAVDATSNPKWNTKPPTSGPHNEQPAVWGSYDDQVPLAQTVHNLEHGGVVIHYGPGVPQSDVDAIGSWYREDPNGLIVSPLATNKDKITLSAWTAPDAETGTKDLGRGWLASCTRFDEGAFDTFVEEHRYKGPERIPAEQLAPGT